MSSEPISYLNADGEPEYAQTNNGLPVDIQGVTLDVTASGVEITNETVTVMQGLDVPLHDYESNTYTNDLLTQTVYKVGGSGGTTVATVTRTYDEDGNLLTVART